MYNQTFFVIARPERDGETPGPRFLQLEGGAPPCWISDPLKALQWDTADEATDFLAEEGRRLNLSRQPSGLTFSLDGCAAYQVEMTIAIVPGESAGD